MLEQPQSLTETKNISNQSDTNMLSQLCEVQHACFGLCLLPPAGITSIAFIHSGLF